MVDVEQGMLKGEGDGEYPMFNIQYSMLNVEMMVGKGALVSEKVLGKQFARPRPGKAVEQMHWLPREHHDRIEKRFPKANWEELRKATDVLEKGFHKYVHGKGAKKSLEEAYNGAVKRWLKAPDNQKPGVDFKRFKKAIRELRRFWSALYQEYQMDF